MKISRIRILLVALAAFLGVASSPASAQTLLSYWNFNNDASSFASTAPNEATFSTTAAAYGEAYASGQLSSNTAGLYHGASVYLDFGYMLSQGATYGGSTGAYAFGVYSDSTVNRLGSDTTAAGSLIGTGTSQQGVIFDFHLDSAGYQNLALSFAFRNTAGSNTTTLYYSTDGGTTFASFTTFGTNAGFTQQTVDLSSLATLNNNASFILRLSTRMNGGSVAFENVQLTGTAVPEPSAAAFLLIAGGLVAVWQGRRFRVRRA